MARRPKGEPPTLTCNAMTKKGLCQENAGANTEHLGYGRCWIHGGASIVPGTGKQLSLPTPTALKAIVEKAKNDPELFDLRREIAISRGVETYVQDMIMQESDVDVVNGLLRTLNSFLATTGRLVKEQHEMENGRKYLISVEDVKRVLEDVITIITEEVEDPELQKTILDRVLTQQSMGTKTIFVPPDSFRYAAEWRAAQEQPIERDKNMSIIHDLNKSIEDEVEVEIPERISMKQYRSELGLAEDPH